MAALSPHDPLVVVVGGANTDIVAFPDGEFTFRDSNPGHVRVSAGGVGRNIAENLARLGARVELITAFGGDEGGSLLAEECRSAGVGLEGSFVADGLPGARYVAVDDEHRDLAAAVSDMRCLGRLTAERLGEPERRGLLTAADLVVADTNLGADTLAWLGDTVGAPLAVDPVSSAKARRAEPILGRLAAIKPSAAEAGALLGIDAPRDVATAEEAAHALVARGVGAAFVTLGAGGVVWADVGGAGMLDAPEVEVANANGAGDAFMAGVVYAMLSGADAPAAATLGRAMAANTLQSEGTVSPALSPEIEAMIAEEAM